MRVALIAPNYLQTESGNHVTVRRIERTLQRLGCETRVFPIECLPAEELVAGVRGFAPRILHAFHGYSGGRVARALSEALGIPYLITLTGTDIYQALTDQRGFETHGALRGAARLVAFDVCVKKRLAEHHASLQERTVVIPQGVEAPAEVAPEPGGEELIFLLPAGLRPAKGILAPLEPLARLHADHPQIRLHIVGPVRDCKYATQVMEALESHPFARYLGGVGHEFMPEIYRGAHVVLNSSLFEGGMANTVLEALAFGKALLASDIEGNRSVIKDGVTGLIYRDAEEFVLKGGRLVEDAHLRRRLGRHGRELVLERFSPEREGEAYLEVYREMLDAQAKPAWSHSSTVS